MLLVLSGLLVARKLLCTDGAGHPTNVSAGPSQALQPFTAVAGIMCFHRAYVMRAIMHCRKCVADAQSVPHDHRRCACCTILKQDVEFEGDSALCKVSAANFAV